MITLQEGPNRVLYDFAALFCGEPLGEGSSRKVFVLSTDPTKVIKIEAGSGSFQNILEWQTWEALSFTKLAKYLAPYHRISPCGIVLIQSRVFPLPPDREKVKMPEFLTDTTRDNFGILEGRVVCADYGSTTLIHHGASAVKMRQPDWR